LYGNANEGVTVESLIGDEGYNCLDYEWRKVL